MFTYVSFLFSYVFIQVTKYFKIEDYNSNHTSKTQEHILAYFLISLLCSVVVQLTPVSTLPRSTLGNKLIIQNVWWNVSLGSFYTNQICCFSSACRWVSWGWWCVWAAQSSGRSQRWWQTLVLSEEFSSSSSSFQRWRPRENQVPPSLRFE